MRNLIVFLLLFSACSDIKVKTISGSNDDMKKLNDSIVYLINSFQLNQDTAIINKALFLNDRVIALDSSNNDLFYNINTRIQILGLLNKKREAFLLREKILSKDDTNIDRLIYYGQKYRLRDQIDSSKIYFNAALVECDKLSNNSFNTEILLKKIEIYIHQRKDKEALKMINKELQEHPENEVLKTFRDDFDEYCKLIRESFPEEDLLVVKEI